MRCVVMQADWPDGHRLAAAMNFRWPQMVATPFKQLIPSAGAEGLALIKDMLAWDPQNRPTCQQVIHMAALPAHGRPSQMLM